MAEPNYNAFHGSEAASDGPRPIGTMESLGTLMRAVWNNRKAFSAAGPVAAVKDIIPELPLNDPIGKFMSNEVMHMLWGSMLHPPSSYKGAKYQYRSANGENNSMLYPDLGKAGLAYAKSVQAQRAVNGAKPDVGDLFDLLMAREDTGRESTTGISTLLLYQATIVIHDVFRTNDNNKDLSDTSSYLDLSPLYGKDAEAQYTVRTHQSGLLKPDTFAEHRLLNQPPGVSIFLIMYNRFHNYVAKQLLSINENGKFDLPYNFRKLSVEDQKTALDKLDEDLFQTARLITCGLYAQIAIHDYLRCLMMMHVKDTAWTLDPRREYNGLFDRGSVPRGQGNMVSVEFNLLYRFHSALSKRDAEWSADLFELWLRNAKDDKGPITRERIDRGDVPLSVMRDQIKAENVQWEKSAEERRTAKFFPPGFDFVGGGKDIFVFKRNADGYFDDAQMVAELVRCIEDPMCSFGARQIPKVFKSIEMLGILQSRKWEVCSLNEFRQFFGMSRHKRFEDINSDPTVYNTLRDLYGDVDSVELYPGYLCEGNGRNLDPDTSCPNNQGTALWRGIFSDAVTLVRSDRFYTTEWNVDAITGWGMREVTSDPTINKGSLLFKLCQRAFPGYFNYNSLHLWEPYYTPAKNLLLAYEQGKLKDLDISGLEYQFEGVSEWVTLEKADEKFFKNLAKRQDVFRLRRKLEAKDNPKPASWRGRELAAKIETPSIVIGSYEGSAKPKDADYLGDYRTIKRSILGGKEAALWANPAIINGTDVVPGPLRQIMTNNYDSERWQKAATILGERLGAEDGLIETARFRGYFATVAEDIRVREQRMLQKVDGEQVYQLDIVSDYAIPIVTRFFADWLGFWDRVKTVEFPDREFSENAVYELLDNCQDYQSWDADQTKGMKRRQLFQASIKKLKGLADYGVSKSADGWLYWRDLFRVYGTGNELKTTPEVIEMRKFAVRTTQTLLRGGFSYDEVSSIMLSFALDSAHKLVLNFTEILAYFIDPKLHSSETVGAPRTDERTELWREIQQLALKETDVADGQITRYALEAQRLTPSVKLARQYVGKDKVIITSDKTTHTIHKGETILLDIHAANRNSNVFPNPETFSLERDPSSYLIYGEVVDDSGSPQAAPFAKQLALAYLTALLKHTAGMKDVRVAHDKLGRLKRVETPANLPGYPSKDALTRYASPQWDALLPFPATWEIRFNGLGEGVFVGGDNADQKHGQNQVYHNDLSAGGMVVKTDAKSDTAPRVVRSKDAKGLASVTVSEIPVEVI